MHPNPIFRNSTRAKDIEFVRDRSFGTLAVNFRDAPLISHIPFQLSEDGTWLEAHLARQNPVLELLDTPVEAVIAVLGGDSYISPDWYRLDNQVPTWNYVAVHLRGKLKRLKEQALRGILDKLAEDMENRLTPKAPWNIGKMNQKAYAAMSRQIVPVALEVNRIDSTWKLSQNKPDRARDGAMLGAGAAQIGARVDELVKQMGSS